MFFEKRHIHHPLTLLRLHTHFYNVLFENYNVNQLIVLLLHSLRLNCNITEYGLQLIHKKKLLQYIL